MNFVGRMKYFLYDAVDLIIIKVNAFQIQAIAVSLKLINFTHPKIFIFLV